ncbi:MAG TPA: type II toxin-antitoxin system death-on-curing family toxin [Bryobacteraceae bacterium]|jgi:death-on-curing protein|nr:type II toxin-antitoxin system death-on-curing family toxin [Bryobacteraceae bacterium]
MTEPRWLALRTALALHETQLDRFRGTMGTPDRPSLEAALAYPQQILAARPEASLSHLAGAYAAGILKYHPFADGNKRTGFLSAYTFLKDNGRHLAAPQTEVVISMRLLAAGAWNEQRFTAWLESRLAAHSRH